MNVAVGLSSSGRSTDSTFFDVPIRDHGATCRVRVYTFQREFGPATD